MTPLGRLYLLRVLSAPCLSSGAAAAAAGPPSRGPGVSGALFSAARTAHQAPLKHLSHGILKPAAHLVGYPSKQNSLLWRANTDRAFLRHGFSLNNNSLLVPTSGLYFVYSQCTEVRVSRATKTVGTLNVPGAVFLLSKGDQLSTHTDGVSHLHFSPSSVFFGAFAL